MWDEFISKVNIGEIQLGDTSSSDAIQTKFKTEILHLIKRYFPKITHETSDMLMNYIMQQYVGFGNIDILLNDAGMAGSGAHGVAVAPLSCRWESLFLPGRGRLLSGTQGERRPVHRLVERG